MCPFDLSILTLKVGDAREKYAHYFPNRFLVLHKQLYITLLGYMYMLFLLLLQLLLHLFTHLVYFPIPKHKLHINVKVTFSSPQVFHNWYAAFINEPFTVTIYR